MEELQPSKLEVASSNLVSRSIFTSHRIDVQAKAHVAQTVERFLGKEEVHRFDSGRGLHSISPILGRTGKMPRRVRIGNSETQTEQFCKLSGGREDGQRKV